MRKGLLGADILLLMSFLWRLPLGDEARVQAERMMDMVLTGLAPQK